MVGQKVETRYVIQNENITIPTIYNTVVQYTNAV